MDKFRKWVAVTVVAVLTVVGAGWFLLVAPKHADAAALRQQADQQQIANRQLGNQLAVLRAQQAALPAEQAKIDAAAVKLPPTPAEPELVRSFVQAAEVAGVELVSVVPGPISAVATSSPNAATAAVAPAGAATAASPLPGAASTDAPLSSLPLTITVAGGYFQAERFLSALEQLPRAVQVTGVTIVPGLPPGATGLSLDDGQHLISTITGVVFVAPAATSLPAATAAQATK